MKQRILLALITIFCLSLSALAQTSRGTVNGVVTDPNGAVIAGATVTLTSVDTSVARTATTNDEGFYRFDAVDLGNYNVTIAASGFGELQKTNVVVNANQTSSIDAQLATGSQEIVVDVSADAGAQLQTEAPVRGGNISTRQVTDLPIVGRNPVALALTLPGVTSNRGGLGIGTFSVNGARGRSNNFLIDGTENNDISVAGQGFQITNTDAVQEVSVQTGNYDAEFGRSGGAVVNVITKGGTNRFRGTLSFLYDTSADDAITAASAEDPVVLARGRPRSTTEYIPNFTFGGPLFFPRFGEGGPRIYNRNRDRAFFFVAYQEARFRAPGSATQLSTLTQAGRDRLRQVFPVGASANVDLYLAATANAVATIPNPAGLDLGDGRGTVQYGIFNRSFDSTSTGKQFQLRFDFNLGENDQLSTRFLSDRGIEPGGGQVSFEGFDADLSQTYYNYLISETHVFSPTLTNEVRLAYNRIQFGFPLATPDGIAGTLPRITFATLSGLGVPGTFPQGRTANNYVVQDTVTKVFGNHTFRGGVDFLRQISTQQAPANPRGSLAYSASTDFTAFGNFVDDFGGTSGAVARDFGSAIYNPGLYRTAVFFQDRWKATQDLTLTLGLRYENFGTPINTLRTAAFTGLFNVNPTTLAGPFSEPNDVQSDNNNFAPTVGIAYSPSFTDGLFGTFFGEKKTVIRAGYQIGYDSFFNNIASNAATSSPNLVATLVNSTGSAGTRGLSNFSNRFPTVAAPLSPFSTQVLVVPNLVNPYYQRFSLGMQREMPGSIVLDVSYVGSKGTKLFITEDLNPLVRPEFRITPAGFAGAVSGRLDSLQGARVIRTNGGGSNYHSGQIEVRRRFANNLQFTGAYTYSKLIDNGSDIFATGVATAGQQSSVPSVFGGQASERGVSQFDRTHRAVFTYVYELPFLREQKGFTGRLFGGFQLSGVTTFESGVPFTVFNGLDADGLGGGLDRPTFNPNGQPGVRAVPVIEPQFIVVNGRTVSNPNFGALIRYMNPDAGGVTIDPNTAQYVVNPAFVAGNPRFIGIPRTGNTGRNTERGPGLNNFNFNILKRTRVSESVFIETRAEFFNIFNHPQFGGGGINSNVNAAPAGQFLTPNNQGVSGGGRTVRYQVKLIF